MTFGSMSKRLVLIHQMVDGRELKGPRCFDTPDLGYGAFYPMNTVFWDFVEWHEARRRTPPAGRSSIGRGGSAAPTLAAGRGRAASRGLSMPSVSAWVASVMEDRMLVPTDAT